eukprot:Lithocolla_globosa_v1_NODE_2290_length_2064_cov_73.453957.p1 type:complete len:383 gc:universal NODE_2290_length_2064_cov_73.453957:184-1332(+)
MTLEVDIEYPEHLHDLHNDYPLCPEQVEIQEEELSDYQRELYKDLHPHPSKEKKIKSSPKLIGKLTNKKNYIVHYRYLKMCERLGLKITKFHRAIGYRQENFLKKYINFNTKQRTAATNDFEKDMYKLMNNSCYGKTMEDVMKRISFALVNDPEKAEKRVAKPTYKRSVIFNEDLVGIHMHKQKIELNKPIYLGQCILDESRRDMSEFHYDVMKKRYGAKCTAMFTDTDSFAYKIETEDVYKDISEMSDKFDLSNYPKEHSLYDTKNKKQLHKMKDELGGTIMTEFCGLRSKMYSYNTHTQTGGLRAKGVGRSAQKKLKHQMYVDCVKNGSQTTVNFNAIRSKNHLLSTVNISKSGLSPYDDKRYICEDGITTLAYGHYSLM